MEFQRAPPLVLGFGVMTLCPRFDQIVPIFNRFGLPLRTKDDGGGWSCCVPSAFAVNRRQSFLAMLSMS